MPCTKYENQEQQNRRMSFRSTFGRTFAGLRFPEEQNLQSFSIPPSHQHARPTNNSPPSPGDDEIDNEIAVPYQRGLIVARSPSTIATEAVVAAASMPPIPPTNSDLTEQVRISVRDTHISQTGGNISDVLDDFQEPIGQIASFSGNQQNFDINAESNNRNVTTTGQSSSHSATNNIYTPHAGSSSSSSLSSASRRRIIIRTNNEFIQINSGQDASSKTTSTGNQSQQNGNRQQSTPSSQTMPDTSSTAITTSVGPEAEVTEQSFIIGNTGNNRTNTSSINRNAVSKESQKNDKQEQKKDLLAVQAVNIKAEQHVLHDMIPPYTNHRQAGVIKNYLYNGSSFSGFQSSQDKSYEVNVKIQHVDYASSYICGYLSIHHLTPCHPSLTTFFEGEIISKQFPFLTRKWDASFEADMAHWSRFEGFDKNYVETFSSDDFDYDELEKSDYIYMRWKEIFLIPDHTVKHIDGASYAGFYYICYSKRTSQIRGYYFHHAEHFERFQTLNLELDRTNSTQVYEFR